MESICDNQSVGVIIRNPKGEVALLTRRKFPIGIAPPAGHIDGHGSPEKAAVDETQEEVGIELALSGLRKTVVQNRRVNNVCRRKGGDHHFWNAYEAETTQTTLRPSVDETKGADWYSSERLQQLADRTKAYQAGEIDEASWTDNPGLEEVWLDFFTELGYVE